MGFEALGEVDILDGDEAGIEAMDFLEIPAMAPEEAEGDAGEGEVGEDGEDAGEDAEGPALGEDEGSAADEFAGGEEAEDVLEGGGVHAAVCIAGDEDVAGGGGGSGIADGG